MGDLVRLKCRPEALSALASGLTHYAPADGEPEWLVAAVWLLMDGAPVIASGSVEVLSDGYLARPLNLHSPEEFASRLEADLPDVAGRFTGRNHGFELPSSVEILSPPSDVTKWPAGPYSMHILIRVAARATTAQRVACGLWFIGSGASLLVGTDPSTLAMVLSDDPAIIDAYRAQCEAVTVDEYLAMLG